MAALKASGPVQMTAPASINRMSAMTTNQQIVPTVKTKMQNSARPGSVVVATLVVATLVVATLVVATLVVATPATILVTPLMVATLMTAGG